VQDIPDAGEPLHSGAVSPLSSDTPQPGIPENQYVPPPAPVDDPYTTSTQIPLQPSPQIPTKLPQEYTPGPPSPPIEAPPSWPTEDPIVPTAPPNIAGPPPPVIPQGPSVPTYAPAPPTVPATAPVPSPAPIPLPVQGGPPPAPLQSRNYKDINQAQKHAKWAISALNFEDIPTAVQELRNALAMLGAQ
jgi:vacuolar protein sorting-associated protein VTA1